MKNLLLFTVVLFCIQSQAQVGYVSTDKSLAVVLSDQAIDTSKNRSGDQAPKKEVKEESIPHPFQLIPSISEPVLGFSKEDDYQMFDVDGNLVKQISGTDKVGVSDLNSGAYFLVNKSGFAQKVIVK